MRLLLLQFASLIQLSRPQPSLNFLSDFGAIPNDKSPSTCAKNKALLQLALQNASSRTLVFPIDQTFYLHHGVVASNFSNSVIQVDGVLKFERQRSKSDRHGIHPTDELPLASLLLRNCENVTVTSRGLSTNATNASFRGVLDGQGWQFWGFPLIGLLEPLEPRPMLLAFQDSTNVLVEHVVLKDSPRYSLQLSHVCNATVKCSSIVTRRTDEDGHSWIDLSAVNTVGVQIASGCRNIHVRDMDIWSQDNCVSIWSASTGSRASEEEAKIRDVVVERVNASGLGFVVSAKGAAALVDNVTFRDSYLHRSVRGLSVKFYADDDVSNGGGMISNVAFQNVFLEAPLKLPLWFGPAQTANASLPNPCQDQTCSVCWPAMASASNPSIQCQAVQNSTLVNVTLTNVTLHNPHQSPGVFLGSKDRQAIIENVVLDRVKVVLSPPNMSDVHPFAKNLLETFPGLYQPLADGFVPNSNSSSQNESMVTDTSEHHTHIYVISGLLGTALLVLSISFVATIKDGRSSSHLTVAGPVDAPIPTFSSSLHPTPDEVLVGNSTIQRSKRVRFVEGLSMLKEIDQTQPADSDSLFSLVAPLLDTSGDPQDPVTLPSRRVAESFRWSHAHWAGLLVLLTVTGLGAWCWKWYCLHRRHNSDSGIPDWEKTDRYFLCEGVNHGVAKGGTWPVPYCLNQRPSQWWVLLRHLHGIYLWVSLGVTGLVVLVGVLVVAWKRCKRRDHCAVNLSSDLPDSSPL